MRTPLAAMVMVMEMTGSFGLIVPLMLVAPTAYVVGRRYGLIDEQVKTALDSPAHAGDGLVHLLEQVHVRDAMDPAWELRVSRRTPLAEVVQRAADRAAPLLPVVEEQRLIGVISLPELRHLLHEELPPLVIAADLMADRPATLAPDESLYSALTAFDARRAEALPVVARDAGSQGIFLGLLSRGDVHRVMRGYTDTMRGHLLREHAGLAAIEAQGELQALLSAMAPERAGAVERVAVEGELAGRSLAELDFRAARKQEVLAIQTREHELICPPDPHRQLSRGDVLVVLTPSARSREARKQAE
jgi:CBS-domain-containing membrane protein